MRTATSMAGLFNWRPTQDRMEAARHRISSAPEPTATRTEPGTIRHMTLTLAHRMKLRRRDQQQRGWKLGTGCHPGTIFAHLAGCRPARRFCQATKDPLAGMTGFGFPACFAQRGTSNVELKAGSGQSRADY